MDGHEWNATSTKYDTKRLNLRWKSGYGGIGHHRVRASQNGLEDGVRLGVY